MTSQYDRQMADAKRAIVTRALIRSHGNRSAAARALGLSRSHFFRLIRELGVTIPATFRGRPPGRET